MKLKRLEGTYLPVEPLGSLEPILFWWVVVPDCQPGIPPGWTWCDRRKAITSQGTPLNTNLGRSMLR
eukprot:6197609-Pleurochrysis_carterae.AAC.2